MDTMDDGRLKALLHYIIAKANPEQLGKTKLYKTILYADIINFTRHGESITGATYTRQPYGPIPHRAKPLLDELARDGTISAVQDRKGDFSYWLFNSLRPPIAGAFGVDAIQLVDELIDIICANHTARSISDFSHDDIWTMAAPGEEIPLEAYLVSQTEPVTADDLAFAREHMGAP